MAGYFSRLFDPPQRLGFFGPEADPKDAATIEFGPQPDPEGAASEDDSPVRPSARRPIFSWDPGHAPLGALGTWPGSLAPAVLGFTQSVRTGAVTPVVANFGPLGGAGKQANRPYWKDIPGYPQTDPRMPFFVLPPNAIFNMPVYNWEQAPVHVPPWVDKEGHPHLDLINPDYDQLVTPGKDS